MSFLKEFLKFIMERKKFWLLPILLFLLIFVVCSYPGNCRSAFHLYNFLMTYILGISAFYHDSAATLIKNGTIISAAQEERFTRKKHDSGFPKNSINFVLNFSRINLRDIDHIVFYEKPFLKFDFYIFLLISIFF